VEQVAQEGGRGEDRPRSDLAGGDGVQQLRRGDPVQAVHQVVLEKGDENVAGAEDYHS